MEQLELRFYTREEIAEVLSININDSKHFKRNVENKLSKWKYCYQYISRKGVEILSKPTTPEDRLAEILYRGYGIDIQIHAAHFAYFVAAFTDIPSFSSMPWAERETAYYQYYGVLVDQKTLRNWCSKLIKRDVIDYQGTPSAWKTYYEDGRKMRVQIDEDHKEDMKLYFRRRHEIFNKTFQQLLEDGITPIEAKSRAWRMTFPTLWGEFNCCYYNCKCFAISAFLPKDSELLQEVYEISRELAPPSLNQINKKLPE